MKAVRSAMVMAVGLAVFAGAAQAQVSSGGLFARESRSLIRDQRAEERSEKKSEAAKAKVSYDITFGWAYTSIEGGDHGANIPLEFTASLPNEGKTVFRLSSDGYGGVSGTGGSARGFADVEAAVSHVFFKGVPLRLGAGVHIATRGQMGGNSDGVFVNGSYRFTLSDALALGVSAKVRQDINHVPVGLNKRVESGGMQLSYAIPNATSVSSVFAQVVRGRRVNAGGSSTAVFGADLKMDSPWGATLSLARGLTRGGKDTTLEMDFTYSF